MEIPVQELLKAAKDSIQFNEQQFTIEDDGVRKTVSIETPSENKSNPIAENYALKILTTRPAYIPAPTSPPTLSGAEFEVWVNIGVVNGTLIENRRDPFVVDSQDFYLALKVELSQSSRNLEITKVTIETSDDQNTFVNAPWDDQELSQTLPAHIYVYLGHVHQESKEITNYGKGSVSLTATVSNYFEDNELTTRFTREIQERRLG